MAKILIVDDIPKNIQILGSVLQQYNYDIYFANNGQSALKQTQTKDFDLILLDIMMPMMDGFEVCQHLKEDAKTKDIPIIFLTAKNDTESVTKAFELGGQDYVTKPFNSSELIARVKTHVKLKKQQEELANMNQSLEKKVAERTLELELANKRLETLDKAKTDFLLLINHELRTPLTSIKGFVDGMLDGTVPMERQQDYLRIVRDETHRMHRMVNDLLDLTKMEAGGAVLLPSVFDVCELVRICVISLQQVLIDKELEFEAEFERERMFIRADRDSVQRLLLNLMQNAVKFTPEKGTIRVAVRTVRDKTEISIGDTGIGISADELPFVFDRFYKTDKSRSSDRTGVGIGLAIVRSIILAHHEEIRVESMQDVGTTFIFTMPSEPDPQGAHEYVPFGDES